MYRCFTCGFSQDFQPTSESVGAIHPWMVGLPVTQCPACTEYLKKYGGRKPGKTNMPDITEPGKLVQDSPEAQEIEHDFQTLLKGENVKGLKKKYSGRKLWGFTPEELVAMHA